MTVQSTILPFILLGIFFASIALSFVAATLASWKLAWFAAAASLAVSIVTGFSIGPFLFLVTCLQLGLAVALRRRLHRAETFGVLLMAVALWFLAEPFQIFVFNWISLLGGMLLVTAIAVIATIWRPARRADPTLG